MGIYSNTEILEGIDTGNIVIDPFNVKHVNASSYDVTLGHYFYKSGNAESKLYNPYDEEDVEEHFGEVMEAESLSQHRKILERLGVTGLKGLPSDHPVIILRPGERILAHTHEFIGIKQGTTSMHARSTTGRNGIVVCMDAGWGDPGYVDRWTMEILNHNEQHVVLPEGIRIAQIVFHHMNAGIAGEYSQLSGKYQTRPADEFDKIKFEWRPEHMKPKAHKDSIPALPIVEGLAGGLL